ncbi:MAG: hypothetical protein E2O84_02135 [Bacteroidetes bacterium]|nr:MAG: hypothetical protein E2O84_02135 [Bacteroidota bacterium]
MPHSIYLIIHVIGLALTVQAVGMAVVSASRATEPDAGEASNRKMIAMFHGIGLFLLLLGGFGTLARLGITFPWWPAWLWVKLIVWITFGASTVMIRKRPETARLWMFLAVVLVAISATMAIMKPF